MSTRDAIANALMAMPFHAATICNAAIKQLLASVRSNAHLGKRNRMQHP
jgi:hypothetical protein